MDKKVYIAGPITGVLNYRHTFFECAIDLETAGYIPLDPAVLPDGLSKAQYMRFAFAMIDAADFVVFLPGSEMSKGAMLEQAYCDYIGKPYKHIVKGEVKKWH